MADRIWVAARYGIPACLVAAVTGIAWLLRSEYIIHTREADDD